MGRRRKNPPKKERGVPTEKSSKSVPSDAFSQQQHENGSFLWVDPARVRFQHSRIRPYFSGCGRSVEGTLESIRKGDLSPLDLPPIQILVSPNMEDSESPWYFSLNNRRLWVLKRCREEGLLENNLIRVRVRVPKSQSEVARYTVENCALEAKIVSEKPRKKERPNKATIVNKVETSLAASGEKERDTLNIRMDDESESDDSSDDSSSAGACSSNRFSALNI